MRLLRKFFSYSVLFFMLSTLFSCFYKEVEIVKLENAFVKKFSSRGIEAEVFLKVKNPNNYDISIVNSDLDIFINEKSVGKAKIADKVIFPKKSEKVHRLLIESDFVQTGGGLLTTLASVLLNQSVSLGIKGDVTAKAMMMQKKVKVDIRENVGYSAK